MVGVIGGEDFIALDVEDNCGAGGVPHGIVERRGDLGGVREGWR